MPTTDTKKKSTSLRISSTLFAHIEKLAKQENRSLNNLLKQLFLMLWNIENQTKTQKKQLQNLKMKKRI